VEAVRSSDNLTQNISRVSCPSNLVCVVRKFPHGMVPMYEGANVGGQHKKLEPSTRSLIHLFDFVIPIKKTLVVAGKVCRFGYEVWLGICVFASMCVCARMRGCLCW
jgi:hypothetical protein